ncbi:HAD family hydrolase [Streptococcus downei]|uniref:Phosphatase n=1 Tax=Streptococcus downei MFe28 TaxID=764290 RepID=A0A380JAY2_STRDO|nr:HAD family phosphatase [Streptococcus downei]EFQ57201.1 HAD hydrolase, family IA, variant 3 [Streptococcus downei F0415]SUN35132.1 phosphatase [Streptococcus downei MFe28]
MKQAVIFDMDGVLFDTEEFYYSRRKTFLAGRGISIDHLPPSFFIGGNMKQVWQKILGSDYDKWDVAQLQADYIAYKLANPLPYQEVIFGDVCPTLDRLSQEGFKIGLASSSTKADILKALSDTDLTHYFDVILSGQEFPESKPDPAIYNKAAELLGFAKEELLVIEDSEKGIAAAVAAGIEVWAIKDERYGLNQTAADRLIASLSQGLDILFEN